MKLEYLYCPDCGYEMLKGGVVYSGPLYANGRTVICPEYREETFEFEVEEENTDLTPTPDAATI